VLAELFRATVDGTLGEWHDPSHQVACMGMADMRFFGIQETVWLELRLKWCEAALDVELEWLSQHTGSLAVSFLHVSSYCANALAAP